MDQPASTDEVHEDFEDCMAAQVLANMEGFDQAHGMYTPANALFRSKKQILCGALTATLTPNPTGRPSHCQQAKWTQPALPLASILGSLPLHIPSHLGMDHQLDCLA